MRVDADDDVPGVGEPHLVQGELSPPPVIVNIRLPGGMDEAAVGTLRRDCAKLLSGHARSEKHDHGAVD